MDGDAPRGSDLAQVVDLELLAAQVPVGARRDARRVARIGRLVMVGPGEADLLRVTVGIRLGDEEPRPAEEPDLGVALVLQLRPGDPVEAAPQHDVAVAVDRLVAERVAQLVREHRLASRSELDVPFRRDLALGAFEPIGTQEQRAARLAVAHRLRPRRAGGGRRRERGR